MRILFFIVCLGFVLAANAQRNIDVLHYRFEINLNDTTDTISGRATILVKFLEETDRLAFDFTSVSNGKGMVVFSVMEKPDDNKMFTNSHAKNKLTINLPQRKKSGDTSTFFIRYKGIPADGLIISKNQYGSRTFFGDNWPNRAHNWLPCVDDIADKATVEFIVTAPSHYQVISNGVQIEETNLPDNKKLTHYREDVPLPTKVMVIGAADFAVNNVGDVNCTPVSSWVFPENKKDGFYDYAIAKDILAFYMDYIGPYAYKKLANVQSKTRFGGMENAGAIFYSEYSVNGYRGEERLIAHEIVHQWFGNMATEKSFAHFWLSEGFATYLTHIYLESKYGMDSLKKRMQEDRDEILSFVKSSKRPVVDSTSNYMSLLNANSYQKGGWVLHMLRRQLGDSVFHKAIRQYYATYAGKNADTKDLQNIFELVSGKKLGKFFQQWLYTPENPRLDVTWKYNKTENNIAITVKQLQASDFELPLEILVQESAVTMPRRMIKTISKRTETFIYPVKSKPVRIEIDPMVSLLFEGTITEVK